MEGQRATKMNSATDASVSVFSADAEFSRMTVLFLRENGYTAEAYPQYTRTDARVAVFDLDSCPPPDGEVCFTAAVGFSRREREDARFPVLLRPFRYDALLSALLNQTGNAFPYSLDRGRRCVHMPYGDVRLSVTELRLFYALVSRIGEAVSADTLLREALPDGDRAALSVYICYLRRKIEKDGVRRILSSRGGGYMLKA